MSAPVTPEEHVPRKMPDRLYERRVVQRERVEVLISYDTAGDETWVDLQDWMDTILVDSGANHETFADIKQRYIPEEPSR